MATKRNAKNTVPALRRHKASSRAYVWHDGRRVYMGRWGDENADRAYRRWCAEYLVAGPTNAVQADEGYTVMELAADFVEARKARYGRQRWSNYEASIRTTCDLYGTTPVSEFGPLALQACRASMMDRGWSRTTINERTSLIRRIVEWGESMERVPRGLSGHLRTVTALGRGEADLRENRSRHAVSDADIEATMPHLPPVVADMVRVHRRVGCRPGELCQMTTAEIDRSAETWWFKPTRHKNSDRGIELAYPIGPEARAILTAYLKLHAPDLPLFSPVESERRRHDVMRAARTSHPGTNKSRDESRRAHPTGVHPGPYSVDAYRRAVQRAAERARVDRWTPHQLRHSRATEVAKAFGVEAARTVLGHQSLSTTLLYAERDRELAAKLAEATG